MLALAMIAISCVHVLVMSIGHQECYHLTVVTSQSDCPTLRSTQVETFNRSKTTPLLIRGVALIYATPSIEV